MEMDELMEFLQKTLETDFGYEDDFVIETALKESLADLKSSKLHTAGPPPESEKPQCSTEVKHSRGHNMPSHRTLFSFD